MNDDYDNNKNILYKTEFFKNTSIWVQYNNNLLRYYMHKKQFEERFSFYSSAKPLAQIRLFYKIIEIGQKRLALQGPPCKKFCPYSTQIVKSLV